MGGLWKKDDVIGCLLDLTRCTIMITLNGELLLNSCGSELAAKHLNKSDGEIPISFLIHYKILYYLLYSCYFSLYICCRIPPCL